jgi:hypothetical protein
MHFPRAGTLEMELIVYRAVHKGIVDHEVHSGVAGDNVQKFYGG